MLQEVVLEYDDSGRPVQVKTTEGAKQTVDKTTYGKDGTVVEEKTVDGKLVMKVTRTFAQGKLGSIRSEDGDGNVRVTTFTYDIYGNTVKTQVVDGAGALVSEQLADIPRPVVPININMTVGANVMSDITLQDITAGFSIERDPMVRKVGADPLSVKVKGSYRRTSSGETLVNNMTQLSLDASFRRLLPWLTVSTQTTATRNPVANLNLDLVIMPIGARFVLVEPPKGMLILDVAPVWNYRTVQVGEVTTDAAGVQTTTYSTKELSLIRGKIQLFTQGMIGPLFYTNYTLFSPQLLALDTDPVMTPLEMLDQRSIITDQLELGLQLAKGLAISQSVQFTRDMTLKNQVPFDETGTCLSTSTLCDGYSITSMTNLRINFSYAR